MSYVPNAVKVALTKSLTNKQGDFKMNVLGIIKNSKKMMLQLETIEDTAAFLQALDIETGHRRNLDPEIVMDVNAAEPDETELFKSAEGTKHLLGNFTSIEELNELKAKARTILEKRLERLKKEFAEQRLE